MIRLLLMSLDPIPVNPRLSIPLREVALSASRSGGPGGQNVNKVSSRVTLTFDIEASETLNPAQKRRLRHRLATRVNRAGVLRVTCQVHRTQGANRREVVERFVGLVAGALARSKPRTATRVPAGEKRRRLAGKKQRAEVKRRRGRVRADGGDH